MPTEDMYSDGPESKGPSTPPESKESSEYGSEQTALLPKSVLGPDLKPGHVCEIEIVSDQGDDYEVKYAEEGDHDEKAEGSGKGDYSEKGSQESSGGMDSMLQD